MPELGRSGRSLTGGYFSNSGVSSIFTSGSSETGGLPIATNNEIIGGIGVGGAPIGQIDAACAQQGVDKILKILE